MLFFFEYHIFNGVQNSQIIKNIEILIQLQTYKFPRSTSYSRRVVRKEKITTKNISIQFFLLYRFTEFEILLHYVCFAACSRYDTKSNKKKYLKTIILYSSGFLSISFQTIKREPGINFKSFYKVRIGCLEQNANQQK